MAHYRFFGSQAVVTLVGAVSPRSLDRMDELQEYLIPVCVWHTVGALLWAC